MLHGPHIIQWGWMYHYLRDGLSLIINTLRQNFTTGTTKSKNPQRSKDLKNFPPHRIITKICPVSIRLSKTLFLTCHTVLSWHVVFMSHPKHLPLSSLSLIKYLTLNVMSVLMQKHQDRKV